MNDMTPTMGHNNPPDPIDETLAPFAEAIEHAEMWLDGDPVTNADQMKEVDGIAKQIRSARSEITRAEQDATAPLYKEWKDEKARWKPTIDDLKRMQDGLAAISGDFKKAEAARKEAERRAAYEVARKKGEAAKAAAAEAQAGDLEAQREADRINAEAIEAKKAASAANKDTVKGLRTVTKFEVTDFAAYWANAITAEEKAAFIEEHARRNHKRLDGVAGLRVWTEKEPY